MSLIIFHINIWLELMPKFYVCYLYLQQLIKKCACFLLNACVWLYNSQSLKIYICFYLWFYILLNMYLLFIVLYTFEIVLKYKQHIFPRNLFL